MADKQQKLTFKWEVGVHPLCITDKLGHPLAIRGEAWASFFMELFPSSNFMELDRVK